MDRASVRRGAEVIRIALFIVCAEPVSDSMSTASWATTVPISRPVADRSDIVPSSTWSDPQSRHGPKSG